MKLKSIKKISSDVRYIIDVFDGPNHIEDFKIDYVDMPNEELISVIRNKYFKYENCKVRHISSGSKYDGKSYLRITVEL